MRILNCLVLILCTVSVESNCPNGCSSHGTCGEKAQCSCYGEWMGADCSLRVCSFGRAFIDNPYGDLNGDGKYSPSRAFSETVNFKVLSKDYVIGGDSEMSYTYYGYGRGNSTTPWNEAHFYRECSNKGLCDRETGQCKCFPGFTGGACERIMCPNECSGHGTCLTIRDMAGSSYSAWDIDSTQKCKCDPGFSGPDCSQRDCPRGADPIKYRHTVTNSLHSINWRTQLSNLQETNSSEGKMNFLKDKPKKVYFTISYTDSYGDIHTTSLNTIEFTSFCTQKGYCVSTPSISANARNSRTGDILQSSLRAHSEMINASLSGIPSNVNPSFYTWSLANLFDATCQNGGNTITSNPSATNVFGKQIGSIQDKIVDNVITNCAGEVQVVQTVTDDDSNDGYLVHPSDKSTKNSKDQVVFTDAPDFRLDEIAAEGCRYFEAPSTTGIDPKAWRRDVNRLSFDGTASSAFGVCDYILIKDDGVSPSLTVNYFYTPEGQLDTAQGVSGEVVKFASIEKQTNGSLTDLEIRRNKDIVVVTSLNDKRQWNKKDGDVVKQYISQSSTSLPECSSRGLCNKATGTCNCFAAYSGLVCEHRSSIAYSF